MAEALVRHLRIAGWEACSAGIEPGGEVNEQAVAAMKEIGCDIRGHCPRHVSDFQHIKFDLVVKMDAPDIADFVHAKWIENWDVPDPAEGGPEEFRKVRDLLRRRVAERLGAGERSVAHRSRWNASTSR